MNLIAFLSVLAGLFVIIALGEPLAARLRISYTVVLAMLGIAIGAGASFLLSTDITDALNPLALSVLSLPITSEAFLYIFLPTLIFQVSLTLDLRRMVEDWVPITVMAIVAVVVATFVIGLSLDPFTSQPLVVCLLIGAIVATTDPSAVVGIFRDIGAPARLSRLAEGESLMNDAAAIALFSVFITQILPWAPQVTVGHQVVHFVVLLVAGALTGYALAVIAVVAMEHLRSTPMAMISVSLALPYLTYILAEHALHVSGVIAVAAAGMTVNLLGPSRMPPGQWRYLTDTWELLSHWSGSLIFILAAIFVPRLLHDVSWHDGLLLLVLIVAATVARALVLFGLLPLMTRLHLSPPVAPAYRTVMLWGGLRGAVTLALALAVTEHELVGAEAKHTVAVLATGFVLFTLLVQGTTLRWLIGRLGLDRLTPIDEALRDQVVAVALQTVREEVADLTQRQHLTREIVRSEAKSFGARIDGAVKTAEAADEILDRDRLTLSLVTLASREKEIILEAFRDREVSSALVERLLLDADRLIEATRAGGRGAYRTQARANLAPGRAYLLAFRLHRQFGISFPLERLMGSRFEVLLSTRMFLRDLHDFVNTKILRIHGQRVTDILHEVLSRREEDLERDIEGLRLQYPGFSEEFERRFIRRAALRFEESEYETAYADGLIGAELYGSLTRGLADRREANQARPKLDLLLQRQEFVSQIPMFQGLEPQTRARLARALVNIYVEPGEVIVHRGDPANAVYFIASGAVELDGAAPQQIRLGRGDMFGELAIFARRPRRTAQVQAITHCALMMLSEQHFLHLVRGEPGLRAKVVAQASAQGMDAGKVEAMLDRRG